MNNPKQNEYTYTCMSKVTGRYLEKLSLTYQMLRQTFFFLIESELNCKE
jgi:hypothetical protein